MYLTKKFVASISFATALLVGPGVTLGGAQAATLDLTVTADNAYALYLSTNNSTLGTQFANTYGGVPGQWATSTTYSVNLTAPVYYLQVIGSNYTTDNGKWNTPGTPNGGGDNPDGFLGQFSLGGSGFVFSNGGTSLVTNVANWTAAPALDNTSWTASITPAQTYGQNGVAPWGTIAGISANAYWIWSTPDNRNYADLSTEILSINNSASPLPAALPLFATGLGALGLLGWRRKRKNAAAIAAA